MSSLQFYHLTLVLLLTHATTYCLADTWGSIEQTEFYSDNGAYVLVIEPVDDWGQKPGHCRGTLYQVIDQDRREPVWSRHLVNNYAPVQVHVADSGDHVVTMDEWGQVGDLPVVIYDRRGSLVMVHNIPSLGLDDDEAIEHITQSVSSYWWNEDAIAFFDENGQHFFVRLYWGRLIAISLKTGRRLDASIVAERTWLEEDWNALTQQATTALPPLIMQGLASDDPKKQRAAAIAAGQLELTEAIPALHNLLESSFFHDEQIGNGPHTRVYTVREAAAQALQALGQEIGDVVLRKELP